MKTKEKFWKWVMGIKPIYVIVICVAVFLLLVSAWFPFPFGVRVNWHYTTYRVNHRGVFYTSCPFAMLGFPFTGNATAGYLKGADFRSFKVLDDDWAKDKSHVWYEYHPDVFDIMVGSGWEDGIWEYAKGEALLSLMKEWRLTWLLEKTSGNTGR